MESNINSKKIIILLVLLVLTGGLFLLLETVSDRKALQEKASGTGPVSVSLSPSSKSLSVGETVNIEVVLSTTADVSLRTVGFDVTYDPAVLEISSDQITCPATFPSKISGSVLTNEIRISCFVETENPRYILQNGSTAVVGRFSAVVKAAPASGSTSLEFNRIVVVDEEEISLVGGSTGATYQVQTSAGPIRIYFEPVSGSTIQKGTNTQVLVKAVSSQSLPVMGFNTITSFDSGVFTVTGVTCGSLIFPTKIIANTSDGKINLGCFRMPDTDEYTIGSTPITIGSFNLSVKDAAVVGSQSVLIFDQAFMLGRSSENYVGNNTATSYTIGAAGVDQCSDNTAYNACSVTKPKRCESGTLVDRCSTCGCPSGQTCQENGGCAVSPTTTPTVPVPTLTPTPIPTLTLTPTEIPVAGTPVLAFSIRSQGIAEVQRADQKVIVRVKKGTFEKTFTNVNLTSGSTGIYSGQVTLDGVAPGTGYSIFVKGPRHLAKKMCENNQTLDKRCGETGTLTLAAGANTFNWSQVIMEGGDLPLSSGQDGVVNSADWTFINNHLDSSDATNLAIADINLDGVVNVGDRLLLRGTLQTKYEEDY